MSPAFRGLVAALWLAPVCPGGAAVPPERLEPFVVALEQIKSKYVDETKVGSDLLLEKAVEGVVAALDPESLVVEGGPAAGPAEPGLVVGVRQGGAWVLDVAEGSPAERAGLSRGDRLLRIDGESASGRKTAWLERALRGGPGSKVWLLWDDVDGAYREAQVERVVAPRPAWRRIGLANADLIQVFRLDEKAAGEIGAAILASKAGVVLDLRRCTGGEPDAALALADSFLPGGAVMATGRGAGGTVVRRYEARRKGRPGAIPLVLLAGLGTRGAGELLAAALAGNRRALVVGDRTFGACGRQSEFAIGKSGRKVRLTVERFFGPDDVSLTGTGVGASIEPPPGPSREALRAIDRHRLVARMADRLLAAPPAEYDPVALAAGDLTLAAPMHKGRSVAEQRGEFEQAFEIVLDGVLREAAIDVPRDDLDASRLTLIARVRVELAKRRKKPEEALAVAMREDPEIALGADLLRAVRRLGPGKADR